MLEGRSLSPPKGGTRLYLMKSIPRAASQELGSRENLGVTETVYKKALSEGDVPEMCSAANRVCTMPHAQAFVVGVNNDSCSEDGHPFVSGFAVFAH